MRRVHWLLYNARRICTRKLNLYTLNPYNYAKLYRGRKCNNAINYVLPYWSGSGAGSDSLQLEWIVSLLVLTSSTRPTWGGLGWSGLDLCDGLGWVGLGWIFFNLPWWVGSKNLLNPTQPDPCTPLAMALFSFMV